MWKALLNFNFKKYTKNYFVLCLSYVFMLTGINGVIKLFLKIPLKYGGANILYQEMNIELSPIYPIVTLLIGVIFMTIKVTQIYKTDGVKQAVLELICAILLTHILGLLVELIPLFSEFIHKFVFW